MFYYLVKPKHFFCLLDRFPNKSIQTCSQFNDSILESRTRLTTFKYFYRNVSVSQKENSVISGEELEKLTISQKFVNQAPIFVQPYLKIIRVDRPIGNWLIIWPSTMGIALATAPSTLPDFYLLSLFIAGSFLMRGAGCIINDILDRDIDRNVERTMNRPLVNGSMSLPQALTLLGVDLSLASLILLQLNTYSILLGMSCMGLVIIYPIFKRISSWPQVVLGMTLNWGILVGFSSVHGSLNTICLPLYGAAVCWTVIYDTIYAFQDIKDDIRQGVKSTAIRFGNNAKVWLSGFAAISTGGLLWTGILTEQTWPYYTAVTFTTLHLLWQIHGGNLNNSRECGMKHKTNSFIGCILFLGLTLGNYIKTIKKDHESLKTTQIFF